MLKAKTQFAPSHLNSILSNNVELTHERTGDQTAAMASVLVIEDEVEMRKVLEKALQSAGHVVSVAADGHEGMKSYRAAPADLVVTDLFMPNQDGIETMINLKREFPEAKIVAISGNVSAA
ncbi:MAG TPA: response regulator, partial [Verrucomicrobiae bacterium]|nr:response regulator [Verrucomicrobiae bacterium]